MKKLIAALLALTLVLAALGAPAMASGKARTVVTLSHTGTLTLNVGDSLQLSATVTPDSPVKWKSSKARVAAVDSSGLVRAVAAGSATVTAKAGGKSAKVKVKVVDPNKPTGVRIAQGKSVTLGVGESLRLDAVLSPATASAALSWKSSKSKVAKVDSGGVVTGVKKGKAKITVKAGKKNASITVKVVAAKQHEHAWQDVTEQRYVVDSPAWDEAVEVAPAWDETVVTGEAWDETVVTKEAWDETVVTPAWTETVVDKEAWTEIIPYIVCNVKYVNGGYYATEAERACNGRWRSVDEFFDAQIEAIGKYGFWDLTHPGEPCPGCTHWCYTSDCDTIEHPAETHTVEHPEEVTVIHHDAEIEVVHHDAETTVIHHDAEYAMAHHDEVGHWESVVTGRVCATCGARE